MPNPLLSICIATYNRAKFIGETLDSILGQLESDVELVVVDGASPDNTPEVMAKYVAQYPTIRYYREQENSGVDKDYDKAVGYASGEYCWLMTDDDLLRPGAVRRVLDKLNGGFDLVVLNAEIRNADFSKVLDERLIKLEHDRVFGVGDQESLFMETTQGLSFIGCTVIKRSVWLERNRQLYFGTLFVHVGVICQHSPIVHAAFIAEPLITIRYGNAMWSARGLEIWMVKWPELIWSFIDFSDQAKSSVCPRGTGHNFKRLMFYRATGIYTTKEFFEILSSKVSGLRRLAYWLAAIVPVTLSYILASIYCMAVRSRGTRMVMYSLLCSRPESWITRRAAKVVGVL
jgi:glycosyltransferase involved in cell wall biosynthesis